MKLLVIDNYDSFVYNLVHLIRHLGVSDISIFRNDKITLDKVANYDKILLSPGPGIPLEAGIMPEIVRKFAPTKSILGVCLGHQCIGEVFGGKLINMKHPVHGKAVPTSIIDKSEPLFEGLPETFEVGRYHSWLVSNDNFPAELQVTAVDAKGDIMSLRHKSYDLRGVQFHPESVLTNHGEKIIHNWLK